MATYQTLEQYQKAIDALKAAGLPARKCYLMRWRY